MASELLPAIKTAAREIAPGPYRLLWRARQAWRALFAYPEMRLGEGGTVSYDRYWEVKGHGSLSAFRRERAEILAGMITPNSRVLDLGCGDCALLDFLREKLGIQGLGLEVSPESVARGRARGFDVRAGDLSDPEVIAGLPDTDHVIASEILEHLPEPEAVVLALKAKRPKSILITVPNTGYLRHRLRLLFGRTPLQWMAHPGEHLRFWTARDLVWWARALGFERPRVSLYRGVPLLNRIWPSLFAEGAVLELRP